MEGVDESVPYPDHYDAHYPQTKALAEQAVLRANGPDLATVSLRPHLIWGPGDNHLIPRIVARGRAGRLRRIGTASKLIDTIYIDNAADAHLLAADRLKPGAADRRQDVLHQPGRTGAAVGPRESHPRHRRLAPRDPLDSLRRRPRHRRRVEAVPGRCASPRSRR